MVGILDYLQVIAEDANYETMITRQNNIDVLKVSVKGLGRSGGTALAEIFTLPCATSKGSATLLRFFTTFAADLDADKLDAEIAAYNEMNISLLCGSIGVHKALRQAYHKFDVILPTDENAAYRQATASFELVLNALQLNFDKAIVIADGHV